MMHVVDVRCCEDSIDITAPDCLSLATYLVAKSRVDVWMSVKHRYS